MTTWSKYFIVDKTLTAVQGSRFGYAFKEFNDAGEPLFYRTADNVQLYDTLELAKVDYDKIPEKVAILNIIIGGVPPQVSVVYKEIVAK